MTDVTDSRLLIPFLPSSLPQSALFKEGITRPPAVDLVDAHHPTEFAGEQHSLPLFFDGFHDLVLTLQAQFAGRPCGLEMVVYHPRALIRPWPVAEEPQYSLDSFQDCSRGVLEIRPALYVAARSIQEPL